MRRSIGAAFAALALSAITVPAVHAADVQRTCTKTSSGSCIRGGQFCPKASYGKKGYDGSGHTYTCKGDKNHPHWMK